MGLALLLILFSFPAYAERLIVYRPYDDVRSGNYIIVKVDGKQCSLGVGGYFETDLDSPKELSITEWSSFTSEKTMTNGGYYKATINNGLFLTFNLEKTGHFEGEKRCR